MADGRTPIDDAMSQAQRLMTLNPVAEPQIEQFWKTQDDFLNETEAFYRDWFRRRHEAATAAIEATRKMSGGNGGQIDPSAALQAIADWQRRSLERVMEDFQDWGRLCTRCAGAVAAAPVEMEKRGHQATAGKTPRTARAESGPAG